MPGRLEPFAVRQASRSSQPINTSAKVSTMTTGQILPSSTRLRYSPKHALGTKMFSSSDGTSRRLIHPEYSSMPKGGTTSKTLGTAETHWYYPKSKRAARETQRTQQWPSWRWRLAAVPAARAQLVKVPGVGGPSTHLAQRAVVALGAVVVALVACVGTATAGGPATLHLAGVHIERRHRVAPVAPCQVERRNGRVEAASHLLCIAL
eukprot:2384772-Prymnesium_polylepis.2